MQVISMFGVVLWIAVSPVPVHSNPPTGGVPSVWRWSGVVFVDSDWVLSSGLQNRLHSVSSHFSLAGWWILAERKL